jgi:hypothetical protein
MKPANAGFLFFTKNMRDNIMRKIKRGSGVPHIVHSNVTGLKAKSKIDNIATSSENIFFVKINKIIIMKK